MRKLTRFLSALMSGVMLASSGICLPLQHITASARGGDFSIDWDYEATHNISSPEDALIYEAGKQIVTSETTGDVSNYLKEHYNEYKWTHVKSWNTFDGDTKPKKPGTTESWTPDNYKIENPLRDALKDPDIKYIALYDDDEHEVHARGTWEPMVIKTDKVLDLNGHTLNIRFNKNRNNSNSDRYQKDNEDDLNCTAFVISEGATLTIIDSSAWRGEGPGGNGTGTIKFNAYMIDPYSYKIKHYTVRDLFHVSDGNLVIYGGTFEAGRAKAQEDDSFKLDKLKSVVGSVISLGVAVTEYATGINLAKGSYNDVHNLLSNAINPNAESQGKTGEDDGTNGQSAIKQRDGTNSTEVQPAGAENKQPTPSGDGEAARDQTIDEKKKQNEKPGSEDEKNKANAKKMQRTISTPSSQRQKTPSSRLLLTRIS
ncbi:MAG: hypothetical protein IK130_11550 [Oscillospiraceae bacterium]|nr:hypothetical protein [Oscillospiraceae bacterium]